MPRVSNRSKVVSVRLPVHEYEVIEEISESLGLDKSTIIRTLIELSLKLLNPDTKFYEVIRPASELLGDQEWLRKKLRKIYRHAQR